MKKLLLFLCAFVFSIGNALADKTVYLKPGVWDQDNPVFAVWAFGAANSTPADQFITMTAVEGTNYYKAIIPDAYTQIIFARCKSGQEPKWNNDTEKDNVWNQTDDITTFADNTLFIITGWDDSPNKKSGYNETTVNMAMLGTITASISTLPAVEGADGLTNTRWGTQGGTDTEWFQIAWNTPQTFNTIKILCEGAMNVTNAPNLAFDIQTSDDGTVWTTRKHVWGKNADGNYITVVLNEDVTASYIRFQGVKQGNYGYSFWEFEVYNIDYSSKTLNSVTLSSYQDISSLYENETIALSVIGKTADEEEIPTGTITWNSSTPSVGTVTNEIFNALTVGTTTISATAGGKSSNEIIFTVNAPQVLGSVELPYRIWSATQGMGGITATVFDTNNNAFEGDVTLSWEGNGPVGAVISGKNITFGAASGAGTYTLQATDGVTTVTAPIYMVGVNPTAPTADAADVLAIYSGTYGKEIFDGWYTGWKWGYGSRDQVVVNNDNCVRIHNVGTYGFPYPEEADLTQYTKLKFDVYTAESVTGYVKIEKTNIADKAFTTAAGQWKTIEIDLSGLTVSEDGNRWVDLYFGSNNSDKDHDVLIDNLYFVNETTAVETESITVSASASSVAVGKTVQLTVKNQGNNTLDASTITFTSSDDTKATVDANGVVTGVAEGNVTITATLTGSNPVISNTIDLTVSPAPAGLELTAGGHTILIQGKHYLDRSENNWELIVSSDDEFSGLGPCFWTLSSGNANMQVNYTKGDDNRTLTISATSSTKPVLYNNFYINFVNGGEANFGPVDNASIIWVEIGVESLNVVVSGNTASVTGPVTASDVATIVSGAGTAAIIDLTGATLTENITIVPTNKNALVVVDGTERTSEKIAKLGETKNIVVYDGNYRRAADGCVITLVDDNASQPAYDFVIDAMKDGVSYIRTIAAGAYASVNSPAPITIPNSLAIYKATDATTSEITFTKQSVGGIGANESVILHNPTGEAVVLTSEVAKMDLNLTANPGGATIGESGVTQFGTARAVAADGSQFALQGGELKQFNAGATIGAFRVYYTGLSSASPAIAIFEDGEGTTAIKAIRNGEIVDGTVYDLQGRRVLNPTKGMYIINGKKVILK